MLEYKINNNSNLIIKVLHKKSPEKTGDFLFVLMNTTGYACGSKKVIPLRRK